MKQKTFIENGSFYKGNLHSHTTRSDGHLSPDELVAAYKERGYHFLAITDHNLYSDFREYDEENFILLPGAELNLMGDEKERRYYHFIILPGDRQRLSEASLPRFVHDERPGRPYFDGYPSLQALIDEMNQRGYMVMINHPFWSRIEYDEILPLRGIFAVEVFNYCSQILENMGESNVCWDALLRNGMRLWGTATDDNHNAYPLDNVRCDSFGGFIMVKAESLTQEDICSALAAGSFYSSMGPEIYDFYVEDGEVVFRCSPCRHIYLNGDRRQIRDAHASIGDTQGITELRCPLYGSEMYVRGECYDFQGRKAYTNPIWLS